MFLQGVFEVFLIVFFFQGRALRADGCVVRGHLRPQPGGAAQEAAGR